MFGGPIIDAADARLRARRILPRLVFEYIDGAAASGHAERRNREAFAGLGLRTKVLNDVRSRDMSTRIFGKTHTMPFGIAPMGMCNLSWPDADLFLARLAASRQVPHGVSTVASTSLETLWEASQGQAWFQLYYSGDGSSTEKLVQRAKGAGYETLVLTVDVPEVGRRPRELKHGFKMPFVMGPKTFMDFAVHPYWSLTSAYRGAPTLGNFGPDDAKRGYVFDREESRAGADWAWFARLRDKWQGNLVVKGVLDPDDAVALRDAGADAIQVSSHGGRQLDSARLPVHALPLIRQALGPDFPVFFDSGIRSGEDVIKALALGADFAFLGRPLQFAMAARHEAGLNEYWNSVQAEFSIGMAQMGVTSIEQIGPDSIIAMS